MTTESKTKNIYFNPPQLRSMYVSAPEEYHILGRGLGKSSGILAYKIQTWAKAMPRCVIANVAVTYQQHLLRTLPAIISGLERLGWIQGIHFFFGSYAPESWGWEKPKIRPLNAKYTMHFYTGAIMQLISQDVKGSANGMNIDVVVSDEAKYLKMESYTEEVRPAMRGNYEFFKPTYRNGFMSYHHNTCMTTDMPTSAEGMWLLDKEKLMDKERCNIVMSLSVEANNLIARKYTETNDVRRHNLSNRIKAIQKTLLKLRLGNPTNTKFKPLVYYQEASSLENIHVLTPAYFQREMQAMDRGTFETSILNRRINKVANSFYDGLSKARHGYANTYDYKFLENVFLDNYIEDCRQDTDLDKDSPLLISGDYGGSFNGLMTAQLGSDNTVRFLNGTHVLHPGKVEDLVKKWKAYYKHHRHKKVVLFTDHTHRGENAVSPDNIAEAIIKHLKSDYMGAWVVEEVYISMTPSYASRYYMWGDFIKGNHKSGMKFQFNENNCKSWLNSCLLAPMETKYDGKIEKNKSSERPNSQTRKYKVPQNIATHYSDGGDILLYGIVHFYSKNSSKTRIPT